MLFPLSGRSVAQNHMNEFDQLQHLERRLYVTLNSTLLHLRFRPGKLFIAVPMT